MNQRGTKKPKPKVTPALTKGDTKPFVGGDQRSNEENKLALTATGANQAQAKNRNTSDGVGGPLPHPKKGKGLKYTGGEKGSPIKPWGGRPPKEKQGVPVVLSHAGTTLSLNKREKNIEGGGNPETK